MDNYEQLVKALRCCISKNPPETCVGCTYSKCNNECAVRRMILDAASAIEDLQAQLPKRGKWITHPEVKNIYGGVYIECPFCGEKYVVQYIADEKFCRNCGADMRAKMEVQE